MKDKDAAIIKVLSDIGYTDEPELTPEQEEQLERALDPEKQFLHDVERLFTTESDDILGDILNDFPDVEYKQDNPIAKKTTTANKPNRVKFRGTTNPPRSSYIHSHEDLKTTLQEKFKNTNVTVENITNLFAIHNIILERSLVLEFGVADLKQYREWERELIDGYTGSLSTDDYLKLKADIQKNGIKQHGVLDMVREDNGGVSVYLGEGNHRMKVALSLGFEKFPATIGYHK